MFSVSRNGPLKVWIRCLGETSGDDVLFEGVRLLDACRKFANDIFDQYRSEMFCTLVLSFVHRLPVVVVVSRETQSVRKVSWS